MQRTLVVCTREGLELWLYSSLCVCAREGGENLTVFMALCAREGVKIWNIYVFLAGLRQIFMHYRIKLWAVFIYCSINLEIMY